ncbi:MAG: Flp pilus assembly complex ATPase component TadA [Pirellulales bacterium]|nr:Flp pilus assembly complex ATPase component TadA [Pirellulales bacterium]
MRQLLFLGFVLAALAATLSLDSPLLAQDAAAPPTSAPPADGGMGVLRSATHSGGVAAVIFPALSIALFLSWVAMGDWVNRDAQIFDLGHKKWNPVVFFPFAVAAVATFFLPIPHWARPLALLIVLIASFIPYFVVHNRHVLPHQTVLTGSWWRHLFASLAGKAGLKVSSERKADYEKGEAVDLFALGAADANADNANLLIARQSPGYLLVKDLIADKARRRSDRALLEYGPQAVAVRHEIDGVWHNGDARDRESGDVMLAVMKTLANLDPKDRRKKQAGRFAAQFEGTKYMMPMVSQGVAGGERVVLTRLNDKQKPPTYESLGMREALRDQWNEVMHRDQGLAIFSTLPGGGLTTLMNASLEETDRLMRDFFAIEEKSRREHEIQNITVHTYDASKGETPATIIPGLVRLYPNVYVIRDMVDAESCTLLMNEVQDNHLIITSVQARESAEALLRFLQMKVPQKQFAAVATAVLYQRLIRKLCPDCKVGYAPPAEVLKKLGIPPGKVQQLFRPPKPEEVEKPCQTCQQIGYIGRTGIFELLMVTDQMREILAKQPSLELLKKAARADGQRSLQEEGILLVAKGITSLQELQRVLK